MQRHMVFSTIPIRYDFEILTFMYGTQASSLQKFYVARQWLQKNSGVHEQAATAAKAPITQLC